MDSITQAALGASVAHLCWHKNLGRKAFVSGAVLGTLPDLDIIAYPFLNGVQRLYWHRGESHSIFFILLASFFICRFFRKKAEQYNLSSTRFFTGLLLIFSTHIAIDFFTVYGTQILSPVNRYGFALGNIYIIDPIYTIPLLGGIFGALKFNEKTGFKTNCAGILISSIYIVFSIASHSYADQIFKKQLRAQNIKVVKSLTSATPMNTVLWRHIAQTDKGTLIGYFSILGNRAEDKIIFDFVPRNEKLIKSVENQPNVKAVKWFSKGFWTAEIKNGVLTLSDLRFGELRPGEKAPYTQWEYIFTWELGNEPNSLKNSRSKTINYKKALTFLWTRLKGNEQKKTMSFKHPD
ncbi:MAG: metal-dependent hydrolase [Desulfobacteraceae bacterium]|nr:metal-dependent hydrolase [Desulfobacteraceae bacterium]